VCYEGSVGGVPQPPQDQFELLKQQKEGGVKVALCA